MTIAIAQSEVVQPTSRVCNVYDETYFGLPVFEIDGKEYAFGTAEQCEMAAQQAARECFDLIPAELIMQYLWLRPEAIDLIRHLQKDCSNETIRIFTLLVTDLDMLAEKAVAAQGRIHFLKLWEREYAEYTLVDFPGLDTAPILEKLELAPDCEEQIYLYPVK